MANANDFPLELCKNSNLLLYLAKQRLKLLTAGVRCYSDKDNSSSTYQYVTKL